MIVLYKDNSIHSNANPKLTTIDIGRKVATISSSHSSPRAHISRTKDDISMPSYRQKEKKPPESTMTGILFFIIVSHFVFIKKSNAGPGELWS